MANILIFKNLSTCAENIEKTTKMLSRINGWLIVLKPLNVEILMKANMTFCEIANIPIQIHNYALHVTLYSALKWYKI